MSNLTGRRILIRVIGQTISHYKILDKLGEGGMGVVYKAEDTTLNRLVALKFLPPHVLAAHKEKERFLNEAQTAARLSHPNICTIYEIDTFGEYTFIAMEYVPGADLAEKIAAGPLEFDEAAAIAIELCSALREAHGADIIHRDIKPANIIISEKGRTVLLDFGLAKLKTHPQLTRTGTTVGTSAYMSPEQVRGERVDHRTDIWSLGVVLYQMLTRELPFRAEHDAAVLYSIANEDPQSISAIRPNVPARLEAIVMKALAKSPSERYQNTDALQADLEVFLGKQGGKTTPASVRLGFEEVRRRRLVRGGWIALAVAIAAAGLWLWPREKTMVTKPPGNTAAPAPALTGQPEPASPVTNMRASSIAVLPLANLSRDSGNEFFVDGMTEELITQLAQIRALKVISRTSIMQYRNTTKRLTEIAKELGVANILEGSVLWANDRVRISVQLIDGTNDEHLWAESYEGDLGDILALQRRVAADVAGEIKVELTDEEQKRLAAAPVVNQEVYRLYLLGRYHWNKRSSADLQKAIDYYKSALELDPRYAPAYAGIAESYLVLCTTTPGPRPSEAYPVARQMAEKALEIDPRLSGAYAVLGGVAFAYDWDWRKAEREFQRAIEFDPNNATAHQWYGEFLASLDRLHDALAEMRIAQDLDPLSLIIVADDAVLLALGGDYDAALEEIRRVHSLDPGFALAYMFASTIYHRMGRKEDAARAQLKYLELGAADDREREEATKLKKAYERGGAETFYRDALEVYEGRYADGRMKAISVADLFERVGEADSAFAWLGKAYDERAITHAIYRSFPSLRSDPRFIDLKKRMGIPNPR